MGAGVFSYNEATAEAAAGDLASVISGLESSLSDLGGFVTSVKSSWDGDEMEVYAGIQSKWDSAATTVQEILTAVNSALGKNTSSVKDMRGQVRGALSAH
ncbi:WXG100 family type VII secretion target [Nakamurella sp. YIM 132087]|uniref:WXG100 family type VII secretion target n=1 Tax=Nakamurella alba TaxID=2665158 RepID=A0A7K1FR35_9ACTN|nr:WXG100 family type VII secretion target [Nakamurella alba]MTD15254.1 WXG100 family type VII secretion target [Nakamurella alba]